MSSELKLHWIR